MSKGFTITLEEDNALSIDFAEPMSYAEFMTVILSTLDAQTHAFLDEIKDETDEETCQAVKCETYDELNFIFGQILERIIPTDSDDFEANLTAEAILKAENEIIEAKYKEMTDEAKRTE